MDVGKIKFMNPIPPPETKSTGEEFNIYKEINHSNDHKQSNSFSNSLKYSEERKDFEKLNQPPEYPQHKEPTEYKESTEPRESRESKEFKNIATTAHTENPEAQKIREMFGTISHRYDLANNILSFGVHHRWRKKVVEWSGAHMGNYILDCATGTGDLAIEFMKVVGKNGLVIGTDFCSEMMDPANEKTLMSLPNERPKFSFQTADVLDLPFENHVFDISSIAFGIRNVSDQVKALKEMARVTKPGGIIMVLEFGQSHLPLFNRLYQLYSKYILPQMGGWITGKKEAYQYLQQSSEKFPSRENFLSLMRSTQCFEREEYKSLTGGIAYIYKARTRSPL